MNSGRRDRDEGREVLELRGGREDVRTGRRFLSDTLTRLGWEEEVDDANLLLSELLSNVALHARTSCKVIVTATPERLRVEVEDGSAAVPRVQHFAIDTTTGRGLRLVEQVAESWGVDRTARGKRVWFCLKHEPAGAERFADKDASFGVAVDGSQPPDVDAVLDRWDGWEEGDGASLLSTFELPR